MNKVSYALGMSLGQSLKGSGVDTIDFDDFLKGVKTIFNGDNPEISAEEGNKVLNEYFTEVKKKRDEELKNESQKNLKEGEAYLRDHKELPGVKTTPSGLQYKVITAVDITNTLEKKTSKKPNAHSRVKCHYEGKLINGQVFDSSYKRGEPATFGLNQVIPGWTEGLQLMNVGEKFEFTLPATLGYGEVGVPGHIPGNSVLIFTVELLDIL